LALIRAIPNSGSEIHSRQPMMTRGVSVVGSLGLTDKFSSLQQRNGIDLDRYMTSAAGGNDRVALTK
jgi:hypothetical protein